MDAAKVGDQIEIIGFDTDTEDDIYLLSLGILKGDKLEIVSKAPFGGPISCKHQNKTFFALRREYALKIKVKILKTE